VASVQFEEAIEAFRGRSPQAGNRQIGIQLYCVSELARRGIPDAKPEVLMPGRYRDKMWDVGVIRDGEPLIAISCKSIMRNHPGTVPNRIDDLLGEAVSLHRDHPRAVLGWLFMMSRRDESKSESRRVERLGGLTPELLMELHARGDAWYRRLIESVTRASDRAGPDDLPEKFEVVSCAQVDFDAHPATIHYLPGAVETPVFFDRIAALYRERFP
jgi:hypothetical protein